MLLSEFVPLWLQDHRCEGPGFWLSPSLEAACGSWTHGLPRCGCYFTCPFFSEARKLRSRQREEGGQAMVGRTSPP